MSNSKQFCKNLFLFLVFCLPVYLSLNPLSAAELAFTQQAFQFPAETENLLIVDTNGDGLQEIISVVDDTLRIYFQNANGFDFDAGYDKLQFPGEAIGWDVSMAYNSAQPNSASIIALIDGKEVLVWRIKDQAIQNPEVIKTSLNGFLTKGTNRLHFSRDVNGDGIDDLIIPGAGVLNLHIRTSDQNSQPEYQPGLSVRSDIRMRTRLNSNQLERRTGQSIRIPMMNLRDVNGDGFDDLISRTDERLDVFIAAQSAERYFPALPSYSLDIAEIEERLGEVDIDNLDFSNLTGLLSLTHEEILEDVDGDGIEDLLLREGGKVSLYGGTAEGMNFDQPRQVLRSGGNVLSTFLMDENEDGLKDLWLWRVEPISVGDIFIWLALSGSIAVEAFIYPNEGERFSRRPNRKLTINLKFPSIIRLATSFSKIADEVQEDNTDTSIPLTTARLDATLAADDLLVIVNNQIEIFLNAIQVDSDQEEGSGEILSSLNYSRERDNYEINIREIIENISINGNTLLEQVDGQSADITLALNTELVVGDIIPAQLNNDELDDVFVFTDTDSSHISGILLLSN
ncbi:MAG: hypothetical protein COA96_11195 [SAR86 cluster bacterium]|uniref:VCBS repeat-containing protein n=1 Tax=SAR86 cluster bacterium TaxID=2030880 RepID=A0A2A5AX51_9GAMM|nr:MAG: hypothetical protein COA96_11195 [SAR86 cluster bacterium]